MTDKLKYLSCFNLFYIVFLSKGQPKLSHVTQIKYSSDLYLNDAFLLLTNFAGLFISFVKIKKIMKLVEKEK